MARFAHMGDLHIGTSHLNPRAEDGRNQRLVDFENAALAAAEDAVSQNVDFCVVAGDLFDDTNLMPAALSGAVKFAEILRESDIEVIVIGGNHDEAEAIGRYSALQFLADHHGIRLYLDQTHVDIENVRLHLVSYRVLSRAQRGRGEILPFEFSDVKENLLVAHGYAPGDGVPDIPEGTDTEIPAEWLTDIRFKLKLLGHIHHLGEVAPDVFYSGSTERRNFGETGELPGYLIHEITSQGTSTTARILRDTEAGQARNVPRPMESAPLNAEGKTAFEVDREVRNIVESSRPGAMLRIVLDNVSDAIDSDMRKAWEKHHRDRGGFHFEASVHTRRVSELLAVDFAEPPEDLAKGIADFIESQEMTDDRAEVLTLVENVIVEARELVMTQESSS